MSLLKELDASEEEMVKKYPEEITGAAAGETIKARIILRIIGKGFTEEELALLSASDRAQLTKLDHYAQAKVALDNIIAIGGGVSDGGAGKLVKGSGQKKWDSKSN